MQRHGKANAITNRNSFGEFPAEEEEVQVQHIFVRRGSVFKLLTILVFEYRTGSDGVVQTEHSPKTSPGGN